MESIYIVSALSAIGVFILLFKIGLKYFVAYQAATDLVVSILLTSIYLGTYSGVLTGLISGIVFSLLLWISSFFVSPQKIDLEWLDIL